MQKVAGLFFFLGGALIILGITSAEIFYPGYNVAHDFISSLASTPPPNSIVREPSAGIFDSAMILSGIFVLCGAIILFRTKYKKEVTVPMMIMGMGAIGVGVFPAFHFVPHVISAAATFIAGAIAAILSFRTTTAPFKYLGLIFGSISLIFLFIGDFVSKMVVPLLGNGGTERFIAYPLMIWLIAFGGYLMNEGKKGSR